MSRVLTIALLAVSLYASAQKKQMPKVGPAACDIYTYKLNNLPVTLDTLKYTFLIEPPRVNIRVSRLYLVDPLERKKEFAKRDRIKSEQEAKGYTFTGVKTINGWSYLTFGR